MHKILILHRHCIAAAFIMLDLFFLTHVHIWSQNAWFHHPSVASKISTLLTQLFALSPLHPFEYVTHDNLGVWVLMGESVVVARLVFDDIMHPLESLAYSTLEEEYLLFEAVIACLPFLSMLLVLCDASLSESKFLHPVLS